MKKAILLLLLLFVNPVFSTVSDGESIRQYFDCDDSTTFTFTFKCNSSDDVLVYEHLISTGVETPLTEDVDYTIAATSGDYLNGGVVTTTSAIASTYRIVIVRSIKKSQETSAGATTVISVEASLDKLTRQVQDLEDRNDRSIHLQESDGTGFDMKIAGLALRAETYPYFSADGSLTFVAGVTPDDVTVSAFGETLIDDADADAAIDTLSSLTSSLIAGDLTTISPWVDIRAHLPAGYVTDGSIDYLTEIQTALDSLTSGGELRVPLGIYKISDELTLGTVNNICIRGTGRGSIIRTSSATANVFNVTGGGNYPDDARGIRITNLSIEGPSASASSGAGIYAQGVHECMFDHLWISTATNRLGQGIYFAGTTNLDTDNSVIADNIITGTSQTGIYLHGGVATAIQENTIRGNVITGAGNNGISLNLACDKNTVVGNTIEESTVSGIVVVGSYNTITGNTCCQASQHGISIERVAPNFTYSNVVANNICRGNDIDNTATYHGINLTNAIRNIVIGNICIDNDDSEIELNAGSRDNYIALNHVYGSDHEATIVDLGTRNHVLFNQEDSNDYVKIDDNLVVTGTLTLNGLAGSATWDPASLGDGAGETKSITATGAALGDFVLVSAPYDLQDCTATAYVQAADTVEIRLQNESTGTRDLASGTWLVRVIKQ